MAAEEHLYTVVFYVPKMAGRMQVEHRHLVRMTAERAEQTREYFAQKREKGEITDYSVHNDDAKVKSYQTFATKMREFFK